MERTGKLAGEDCVAHWLRCGAIDRTGDRVIRHNARVLLSCERVIINLMQHMSGIATYTRRFVAAIQGTHARVLDTRKVGTGQPFGGTLSPPVDVLNAGCSALSTSR